eukprot:372185_1
MGSIIVLVSCTIISHGGIIDDAICLSNCNTASKLTNSIFTNDLPVQFLEYNATVFNELEDVNIVLASMNNPTQKDVLLHDLGQIIVKHGLEQLVGVVNLHKHFDLDPVERMVVVNEIQDNIVYHGKPVNNHSENSECIPFMFKLISNNEAQQWAPLQYFCDERKGDLFSLHLGMTSGEFDLFLNDISSILTQNDAENKIGLYYRYDKYANINYIESNQFLLEKTYDDRHQTFEVSNWNDTNELNFMPTQYMFDDVKCDETTSIMEGTVSCINPKQHACVTMCQATQGSHNSWHQKTQ